MTDTDARCAALAVAVIAALVCCAPATAAPRAGGGTAAPVAGNGTLLPVRPSSDPGGDPAATASGQGDALAQNGLGSVLCRDRRLRLALSAAAQANCSTSSFVAAPAPTGNYGFDVHIDTGLLPGAGTLAMLVQDLVLTPVWTGLVWVTHALLVALEWCYSLDLLDGTTMGAIASALRSVQTTVTQPWLAAVLAIAAVLAMYHGVIRRRVAQTLGEVLLMGGMMAVGLWVILDPVGTVGNLGHWANGASLGAVAAVESGSAGEAESSLGDSMRGVFATAVGGPWCFLEFGNVDWCREPRQLDPRLRAAAVQIARAERAAGTPTARDSSMLLDAAQTNGDLFLALPANGPQRNSINDAGSLLHVLCQSTDANRCSGPTAAQAEFRTAGATWSRAGGLLLIAVGSVGMVCLLSFIALRLLGAAVTSLLYLLMAPVAVLAPALGDGGRAAFRAWGRRLLGAVLAKLIYSILLGVVLLMVRLLEGVGGLGWWTQWLLVVCLWWTAFAHRHQVLGLVTGEPARGRPNAFRPAGLLYGRDLGRLAARVREGVHSGRRPPPARSSPARDAAGPSATTASNDADVADAPVSGSASRISQSRPSGLSDEDQKLLASQLSRIEPESESAPADARRRLQRLEQARTDARAAGDVRRVRRLEDRARQAAAELGGDDAIGRESRTAYRPGSADIPAWLDGQALRPSGRERAAPGVQRRDYQALAGLAGLTPPRYRDASGSEQLRARLAIDRELDRRRHVLSDQQGATVVAGPLRHVPREPRPPGEPRHSPVGVTPPSRRGQGGLASAPARESTAMRRERQLLRELGTAPRSSASGKRPDANG